MITNSTDWVSSRIKQRSTKMKYHVFTGTTYKGVTDELEVLATDDIEEAKKTASYHAYVYKRDKQKNDPYVEIRVYADDEQLDYDTIDFE